jgi:hypothetical protein
VSLLHLFCLFGFLAAARHHRFQSGVHLRQLLTLLNFVESYVKKSVVDGESKVIIRETEEAELVKMSLVLKDGVLKFSVDQQVEDVLDGVALHLLQFTVLVDVDLLETTVNLQVHLVAWLLL